MAIKSTLKLENGTELHLCPVSQVTIDEIIDDLGGYNLQARLSELPDDELLEYFQSMPPDELEEYNEALHRQTLYCLGFGITDTPPDDAIQILKHIGKHSDIEQIERANWILYVAGISRSEKSTIVGTIMALTRINDV